MPLEDEGDIQAGGSVHDPASLRDERLGEALDAAHRGASGAAERLLPLVYDELRRLARSRLGRVPPGQTLQPTALVHEAWMRLAQRRPDGWANRAEFFYAAARAMRDILVEDARRKETLKRGGNRERLSMHAIDDGAPTIEAPPNVEALSEAIESMSRDHPEAARVVMLRYFTGLTAAETAEALECSLSTVERLWRFARAWLRRALDSDCAS